ncbi:hypothetical protein ACS0TY_007181 [Phlomoides rotata]
MAYAAVVSLMNTIQRLLNSPHISFDFPNREMLESVYEEAQSLQQVLEMSDNKRNGRERMKAWKERMREKVFKLEDVLESHVSQHFLSPPENHTDYEGCSLILFQLNLLALRQDMHCFTDTANKMKEEYYLNEEEEEDDGGGAIDSLSMDTGENKTEMVGLTAFFDNLVKKVVKCHKFPALLITGMAGIGKTRLAKKILEDSLILRNFESFAFVRMGLEYRLNEVLRAILAQVSPESGTMPVEGDDRVYEYLCTSLKGKKYLIVLDDVWDADFWIDLRRRFPMEGNGSVILVTTRLEKLANSIDCVLYKMPFLKDEESWDLLRVKVFANEVCPRQLEKAGRKIALKCEGLPLMVVTVANLLSKAEKTLEYWNKVATNRQNSVFLEAYHSIFEVLYPSYHYLLQYLKPCFLYMGTFPQNYQVRLTRLVPLWQAEGFLEPNPQNYLHCLKYYTMEYMDELASSNLVMECKWNVFRAICWKLHSVYWHLCKEAAGNERFLQILEVYTDCFKQGIESQRRLAVHCNSLFGIKHVYRLLASISTARSLLCTGEYHQYQVPICLELRLLRVLDALTIRFYDFPMEVLKLVMLRYLALTCNGDIPPSISKLWNLEYLIISPHLSIKSPAVDSYLPEEIWDLQLLKYLHIKGRNLPDPRGAAELPHLHTLLDVGARTCTKGVLDATPNLVKLRIEIELSPDSAQVHQIFDRVIPHLYQLESLQCVIVNPGLRFGFIVPPPSCSVSSSRLQNLILSGLGYPWESMRQIAKLPFLEVLHLQCYAFCGEKWQVRNDEFTKLVYLIIEDTDLVKWTFESFCFGRLDAITIRNCYKLQNIPSTPSLRKIWLDDCNPLAVACAKQMETKARVYVRSSWLGDVLFKS